MPKYNQIPENTMSHITLVFFTNEYYFLLFKWQFILFHFIYVIIFSIKMTLTFWGENAFLN